MFRGGRAIHPNSLHLVFKEFPLRNQLLERPVAVQNNIRDLRLAAGLSQQSAADRFNLSLRVWQSKESAKNPGQLSQGEYELLLLLAGQHPYFALVSQQKK